MGAMFLILGTFILTTGVYATLIFLATRRLAAYLQNNEVAVKALSEHLFLPLLGRKEESDDGVQADPLPEVPPKAGGVPAPRSAKNPLP